MRILHVNKYVYRRGGAEGYMQDVAALQAAAGHEVAFFGMTHPDNPPLPYAADFPPYIELEPPPAGTLARAKAAARMVYSTSSRRGLAAVVDDFRPDVVHLHNVYHQLSPSILRPLVDRRVTSVMTLHDYKLACPSYQFLANGQVCTACLDGKFRHAVQLRCKDGSLASSALLAAETRLHRTLRAYAPVRVFISPSRFLAGKMVEAGVFPERMHVLNNFVDPAGIEPKASPGGGVVFAGRLSREKGVDTLVAAAEQLPDGIHVDVAGEGPQLAALQAQADQQAPGRVRFHGRLAKADLLALLRTAAVAVVPSRWHENMPMAVLEAFACGLPVVTTDLGGLPELVTPGEDGAIVAADNPTGLAQALTDIVSDPERAFTMGKSARAKLESTFAPEDHLRRLHALYDLAAGGPR
jgi:glycosyltransferase involved in cell wall biosynthesis